MDIRTILADHGIEDASKATVEGDFGLLIERLNDLDTFIQGAFRDGLIDEMEMKRLQIYINILADANKSILERYTEIEATEAIQGTTIHEELVAAKNKYDTDYANLISAITYAISDKVATPEEATEIDNLYITLMETSAAFEKAMQKAFNSIINIRAGEAERNAKEYADGILEDVTEVTDDLRRRLNETEGYIGGAFRDGIISEMEARNIGGYLNTLALQKDQVDQQYQEIYNNYFLTGVPKDNLRDAKARYNAKYTALISAIRDAAEDNEATEEEAAAVQQAFVDLGTELANLTSALEKAVDALAQERADKAEQLAKEYAASIAGEKAAAAEQAAKDFAAAEQEATLAEAKAYADGVVTEEEQRAIDDANAKLAEAKRYAEERAEEARRAAEEFAEGKIGEADEANTRYAEAQMYLQKVMNQAYLDGTITPEEQEDIDEAQRRLEEAKGAADTLTKEAILAAQAYSDQQAKEARLAAEAFAAAEAEAKRLEAQAYADGIVTAEEERAIADARAKLAEAKEHAQQEASQAESAAKLYANAEAEAAKLYADDRVKEVEKEIVYKVEIISSNGIVFKNGEISTLLEARVYHGAKDVTDEIDANRFRWTKTSNDPEADKRWNDSHFGGTKSVTITKEDIYVRATFNVDILQDE